MGKGTGEEMTQDEIIKMAREAGILAVHTEGDGHWHQQFLALEVFAKLVAAKEREACAKIIDDSYETTAPNQGIPEDWLLNLSEAIRARGKA
jgi:glutamine phosphoribosylpyrophosphate amidotransferase